MADELEPASRISFNLERVGVVAARYESGSIVLTTNRAFREWGTLLDVDNTLATALIDRLMHHGEPLVIKGDSYRMKDKDNPDNPSDPSA